MEYPNKTVSVSGSVVATATVAYDYPEHMVKPFRRIRWFDGSWSVDDLCCLRLDDAVVTSAFTVIDPIAGRYFLDQSYSHLQDFFDLSARLNGDRFTFDGLVYIWNGPHVVLGGPIDEVWHHWIFQWTMRLAILKLFRPDLLADPSVKFLVDHRVFEEPYRSILSAYGIVKDRLTPVHATMNQTLPQGFLVSFLDQDFYYPEIMDGFVEQIRTGLDVPIGAPPSVRLFCSRQGFDMPKRRVANFAAIEAILVRYGFRIVQLATMTAEEQFRLFTSAEVVVGMHGADLAGILFCQPGARLLLMENQRNLVSGLAGTYRTLADLRGMTHSTLVVDEIIEDGVDYAHFGHRHNRDYVIDPAAFEAELAAMGLSPV